MLIVMGPLLPVFSAAAGADSLAAFVRRTVDLDGFGVIAGVAFVLVRRPRGHGR